MNNGLDNLNDEPVIDVDDKKEESPVVIYDISNYGVDYDVEGLVKRLNRGDIYIPPFQRDYVWNQAEASRLIESLLLGLPIPGVFLAKEPESNKLLVIDGQQRLKTLQYFYNGFFNPKEGDNRKRVFKLIKVQKRYETLTYEELDEEDRIMLDDSIIHATIIKQESPNDDNTSIYHVFERLNTGGRKLTPQEIRAAIYIGRLNDLIAKLNDYSSWRELFGKKNNRMKDHEMILRFFAILRGLDEYTKPMKEFLNKFNKKHRNASEEILDELESLFKYACDEILEHLGKSAFRPDRVFNTGAFEVLTVCVAKNKRAGTPLNMNLLSQKIALIYEDPNFIETITRATSDEKIVKKRHELFDKFIAENVQ